MRGESIDFVITWVDGGDAAWQAEKNRYGKEMYPAGASALRRAENDDSDERYRDWDNLKYWFRGVEKYAPWVRKIHFVTWGHLPEWLLTYLGPACLDSEPQFLSLAVQADVLP